MMKLLSALGIICVPAISLKAQQPPDSAWYSHHHGIHHRRYVMMKQLDLTETQKQQTKSINENFRNKIKALNKNEDITVREWKQERAGLLKEHRVAIQNVLTPEQKAKMEQMRQTASAHIHEMSKKRLGKMKAELNLSNGQATKINALSANLKSQIKAIQENDALSIEEKREQAMALKRQHKQDFKNVLTEDQLSKLKELRRDRAERRLSR
ncbi:MAG: hypothetical protein JST47_05370 [Bacteroidetes bacterium]|nr:hypothetical protein [Bacteroidota bacterium]MBS1974399.1 hypothetical protein [Bacteroidota bacterium]